ncbi:MAG: hypothetical protein ACP5JP_09075 [bacterium]
MAKKIVFIILFLGLISVNARAGYLETEANNITEETAKTPIGLELNTGYLGTKIADPGWRYISSDNWLGSWYIEGAYSVYKSTDVFVSYGYSNYTPSQSGSPVGGSPSIILTTNNVTVGARYSYSLSRWLVPYIELGISAYIAFISISESQQQIKEQDSLVAPELTAGFYIPLKVPDKTGTLGINIQCAFGLIREYFVKPLTFDFGYLGKINMDGQRLTLGMGISF